MRLIDFPEDFSKTHVPGVVPDHEPKTLFKQIAGLLRHFIPSEVSAAGESVSEASLLAERMGWLAPRILVLSQWRFELSVQESLEAPTIREAMGLARRVTQVAETLPGTREDLFLFMDTYGPTVHELMKLTDSATRNSRDFMESLSFLVGRPRIATTTVGTPQRGFDITEYLSLIHISEPTRPY